MSSISVWEASVLIRKGRLRLRDADPSKWIGKALKHSPLREAPLTHAIAIESQVLDIDSWDPADRFIAATTGVLDATLITADERLLSRPDTQGAAELVRGRLDAVAIRGIYAILEP